MSIEEQIAIGDTRLGRVHTPVEMTGDAHEHTLNLAADRLLQLMAWASVLGAVVTVVAIIMPTLTTASDGLPVDLLFLLACSGAFAATLFFVIRGVRRGQRWARVAGMSCGALALAAFPVGTVLGGHVLWSLLFHWEKAAHRET